MSKIWNYLKSLNWSVIVIFLFLFAVLVIPHPKKENEVLKSYGDGVQNHLTWDIKGQCYFVRPNDDVTVYLIRVTDCDKK